LDLAFLKSIHQIPKDSLKGSSKRIMEDNERRIKRALEKEKVYNW